MVSSVSGISPEGRPTRLLDLICELLVSHANRLRYHKPCTPFSSWLWCWCRWCLWSCFWCRCGSLQQHSAQILDRTLDNIAKASTRREDRHGGYMCRIRASFPLSDHLDCQANATTAAKQAATAAKQAATSARGRKKTHRDTLPIPPTAPTSLGDMIAKD